jgi:hypothetical protein
MGAAERKSTRRVEPAGDVPGAATGGVTGLGDFEHGQYTVEGEIERIGAFAAGARRAEGWKGRLALYLLLAILVLPVVVGLVVNLVG